MTWALDTPVRVDDYVLSAIVEVRVSVHTAGRIMTAEGEKRPLLFLVLHGEKASGIDVTGHTYEAEEIESLFPHAIERMKARMSAETAG